jgi:hypothetical protein
MLKKKSIKEKPYGDAVSKSTFLKRLSLNKGANSCMISMRKLPDKNSKYDPCM